MVCILNLLDRMAAISDDAELHDAIASATASPWRVAVLGRIGVGKSRRINEAMGRKVAPEGLGGTTQITSIYALKDKEWVDTVGVDGVNEAIARLAPLTDDVDAIAWVTDGLQPLTRSERTVLDALWNGQAVYLLTSRLDLVDKAERDAVRDRVSTLSAPWNAEVIAELGDISPNTRSPRRWNPLAKALSSFLKRLRIPPTAEDFVELRQWWRLSAAEAGSITELADQLCDHPTVLRSEATLHIPDIPTIEGWNVAGVLGGRHRRDRKAQAAFSSWVMDVEAALADLADENLARASDAEICRRLEAKRLAEELLEPERSGD